MTKTDLKVEDSSQCNQPNSYGVYGVSVASNFNFSTYLYQINQPASLQVELFDHPPQEADHDFGDIVYQSPSLLENGKSAFCIYKNDSHYCLRLTNIFDFYVSKNSIRGYLLDSDYISGMEVWLLGMVFSFWLEQQGLLALHASSVVIEDSAVAFLASNKGGKTSLATSFLQDGYALLTDDILPVSLSKSVIYGYPGYPQIRLWPEQAKLFGFDPASLPLVHPAFSKRRVQVGENGIGHFHQEKTPLKCFYLPERRDNNDCDQSISIQTISPQFSIIEIIRNSFIPEVVEGIGLQSSRLSKIAAILQKIPVKRIVYPNGMQYLTQVKRAILEDLSSF